jgi:hypothetical protein
MDRLFMHADVVSGFSASIRKKLGPMPAERERAHVAHYAQLTALHEACHAVAYVLTGAELISVDILPGEKGLGYTLPNLKTATHEQIARGCFAGCIGELLSDDASTFVQATDHDVGQAVLTCMMICSGGDPAATVNAVALQRVIRKQWDAISKLLLRPSSFAALHAVAASLLEHAKLTGAQVEAIVERTRLRARKVTPRLAEAKETVAEITPLIGDLSRRWLTPCGTRLREGTYAIVKNTASTA